MVRKIVAKTAKWRIRNTSDRPARVSKDLFAAQFRARPLGIETGDDSSPLVLLQLRDQVLERLQSTGGRPSLSNITKKVKVPVTEDDLRELETIAQQVKSGKFRPSTAQIASMILHQALHRRSRRTFEREIDVSESALVSFVASRSGLTQDAAAKAIDGVFDAIAGALRESSDVRIAGFGTFSVAKRLTTRNAATGEFSLNVAPKKPKSGTNKSSKEAAG